MTTLLWSLFAYGLSPDLQGLGVEMRDGQRLNTDVYLPDEVRAPTVLMRTPYGKTLGALLAPRYTEAGAVVVVQDTRGARDPHVPFMAFSSDGDGELQDGYDTIDWITEQPWSDGTAASTGMSALGIVQYRYLYKSSYKIHVQLYDSLFTYIKTLPHDTHINTRCAASAHPHTDTWLVHGY